MFIGGSGGQGVRDETTIGAASASRVRAGPHQGPQLAVGGYHHWGQDQPLQQRGEADAEQRRHARRTAQLPARADEFYLLDAVKAIALDDHDGAAGPGDAGQLARRSARPATVNIVSAIRTSPQGAVQQCPGDAHAIRRRPDRVEPDVGDFPCQIEDKRERRPKSGTGDEAERNGGAAGVPIRVTPPGSRGRAQGVREGRRCGAGCRGVASAAAQRLAGHSLSPKSIHATTAPRPISISVSIKYPPYFAVARRRWFRRCPLFPHPTDGRPSVRHRRPG